MQKNKTKSFAPIFSSEYWSSAFKEVTSLRTLAVCAVFIAMRVALKSVKIPVGDNLNIFIGFLANAVCCAICGPVLGFMSGAVCDILGFIIAPDGVFMPMFTLIEALGSFFYGLFLYKAKIGSVRIFLSKLFINIFCNILFTSFAMNLYYGKGFIYYFLPRIIKNILILPVEVMLLVLLFNALTPVMTGMKLLPSPQDKMKVNVIRYIVVVVILAAVGVLTYLYFGQLTDFFKALLGIAK